MLMHDHPLAVDLAVAHGRAKPHINWTFHATQVEKRGPDGHEALLTLADLEAPKARLQERSQSAGATPAIDQS